MKKTRVDGFHDKCFMIEQFTEAIQKFSFAKLCKFKYITEITKAINKQQIYVNIKKISA